MEGREGRTRRQIGRKGIDRRLKPVEVVVDLGGVSHLSVRERMRTRDALGFGQISRAEGARCVERLLFGGPFRRGR